MFVSEKDIKQVLQLYNVPCDRIDYISKGVMTDKFVFDNKYIIRCYPECRGYLAEAEYQYMQEFLRRGILCPKPVKIVHVKQSSCLIYERVEGKMLTDVYDGMSATKKDTICAEIIQNYLYISQMPCNGYGEMLGYQQFTYQSMSDWFRRVIENAEKWMVQYGTEDLFNRSILETFREKTAIIKSQIPVLVWSDFSMDNIIVDEDGHLAGFVDFEGLMAIDSTLGIGYMQAHENNSDFSRRIIDQIHVNKEIVDFYALLRYLALLPQAYKNLPNGTKRQPIESYLPYIQTLIEK